MRYKGITTEKGALFLDICVDEREERIYCIVIFAIYETPDTRGDYKTFDFATLKAANKKFRALLNRI